MLHLLSTSISSRRKRRVIQNPPDHWSSSTYNITPYLATYQFRLSQTSPKMSEELNEPATTWQEAWRLEDEHYYGGLFTVSILYIMRFVVSRLLPNPDKF